jgi:hypothetical protein
MKYSRPSAVCFMNPISWEMLDILLP